MARQMTGAEMVVQALIDQGVDTIFGYPGGAALPIYDELFQQDKIQHILVRHEQGAAHAAEGYARSTGKPGVVLVTSGPGATNTVTGLTDALLDSIPIVVITAQVPTFMIGTDAFQEADTVGITRPCTKHNYLVKDTEVLAGVVHEAFHVATTGRPGPVLIDIPKDVQFAKGSYTEKAKAPTGHYAPKVKGDIDQITALAALMETAKKPIIYSGGGVINSGDSATALLRELAKDTGFPVTSTLMGLGAYPASGQQWLGMLGMHGLYEANMAMHDCDLMINIGARFDDRITGRIDAFSPKSNKTNGEGLSKWWKQIEQWRAIRCLDYKNTEKVIKPQYALQRLEALTKDRKDRYITTEVGQHQMWAAQYLGFEDPNRWMTSGGLGTSSSSSTTSAWAWCANGRTCCMATAIRIAGLRPCQTSCCSRRHLGPRASPSPTRPIWMTRLWRC